MSENNPLPSTKIKHGIANDIVLDIKDHTVIEKSAKKITFTELFENLNNWLFYIPLFRLLINYYFLNYLQQL